MSLASSGGAAILRAAQKDEYFINKLTSCVSEVVRLFGNRTWNRYSSLIPCGSQIAYGSLTTLKDLQTLGEEYTGIIQVDDSYNKLPGKFYQILAIVLGACGESVTRKALNKLKQDVRANQEMLPTPKMYLMRTLDVLLWSLPILRDLHRAWFYLGGQHYNVSKRVAGINYVNAVPGLTFRTDLLKPLGIPCLLRAILAAAQSPPSFDDLEARETRASGSNSSVCCPGCLEKNETPCALPCGHVLCNQCARGSHTCALCRAPYHPNRTVPLQNFTSVGERKLSSR